MSDWTARWEEVKRSWDDTWERAYQWAVERYRDVVEEDPEAFAGRAQAFLGVLKVWRKLLERYEALLSQPGATEEDRERFEEHAANWQKISAGFFSNAEPVDDQAAASVGAVPVLVVLGFAVAAAAIAWAIAIYEDAVADRDQTALELRELEARVEASKEGRTLPPSTLPARRKEASDERKGGMGAYLGVGLAVTALGLGMWFARRRAA